MTVISRKYSLGLKLSTPNNLRIYNYQRILFTILKKIYNNARTLHNF